MKNDVLHVKTTISYGLKERCELQVVDMPGVSYRDYSCRPFPAHAADHCEKENRLFCVVWTTAGYLAELGAGFAALALFSLVVGVTTRSRRRRIWKAVAGLVILHGNIQHRRSNAAIGLTFSAVLLQIAAFAIVTHLYSTSQFLAFDNAMPGEQSTSISSFHRLKCSM